MDYRSAVLPLVAIVLCAGCLGAGSGGPQGDVSDAETDTVEEEPGADDAGTASDSSDSDSTSNSASTSDSVDSSDSGSTSDSDSTSDPSNSSSTVVSAHTSDRSSVPTASQALEGSEQYYLYVNEDDRARNVSLFVLDGDVESLEFDLANGSTVDATWPAPEVLREDVTDVRPGGDVHWSETFTVESGATLLLTFRNATRSTSVMKLSVPNSSSTGGPLSDLTLGSTSVSQTVAVDGNGSQRSTSGRPIDATEYADVSVDANRTIDLHSANSN